VGNISVVIMAAGQGTRMKSSTPKVLHKICGKEMLHYSILEAKELSNDISIILYHQADRVEAAMQAQFEGIEYVLQKYESHPGTGGALMSAPINDGLVVVLNGDMPLVQARSVKRLMDLDADVVMTAIKLENPSGYGRVVTDGDSVVRIVEEKDASASEKSIKLVNAGVYTFRADFLKEFLPQLTNDNAQKEYYATDLIEMATLNGKVVKWVEVDEKEFKGVNSKVDLADAEDIMCERIRKKWMLAGVTMRNPKSIHIDSDAVFEGECEVESGCVIKGKSFIKNSVIKANSVIEDASLIDSDVGPMARIRPKSELTSTHIGNFVEVKASSLTGVKAGHLSYLGDAQIDEGTNIGAGTITCNYDGVNKYKTKIGKNVFIGSDTQLVAPITIGDGAMIAAGTTVTKDVASGSLAISRTAQKEIAGFSEKFFKEKTKK
jgi:bifunctional UDP-N-acetylglucosamine pyrophosphorylase / glucosamine-1-phosphate N-acetyltransferase